MWIIFSIYIYYKHGNKKMCAKGKENDKPEFSDASYFMMLFTCGVAVGMFFFGVTEPTYYYTNAGMSRYTNDPGMTSSEKAQWALTLTVFHWGLHGWVPYCLVGLTLGFACYRQGKPLTMRSTLYPLLGNRINGWMGDVVDILSIVVVVAGVCTSLGLGTQQIAQGIYRLDKDIFDNNDLDEQRNAWVVIIICITLVACVSVVSGIDRGIKYTAKTAFLLANFVGLMVFLLDDPVYFLDIIVQTCGHYMQHVVELGFQTDAFQRQRQHGTAAGEYTGAVNKPDYIFPGAPLDAYNTDGTHGGSPKMMQYWTIFYWGWWIAWSPFVGMFIARISKGRTVREVFNYSMTAPLLYSIIWFSIFGGAGIKMVNTALECKNQETLGLGGAGNPFADEYSKAVCCQITTEHGRTGWEILEVAGDYNKTRYPNGIVNASMCEYLRPDMSRTALTDVSGLSNLTDMTQDQKDFVTRGSFKITNNDARRTVYEFSYDGPANFFEVLEQYYGWGDFLTGVTVVTIILYFVTSSDSGSFVVDLISAGGNRDRHGNERDPHWFQRVLWSLTEGGLAVGLMYAGGNDATAALRAMSIAVGLPFTIVLCLMVPSLLRMLEFEDGTSKMSDYEWKMPVLGGVFDGVDFIFSFGGMLGGCPTGGYFISHAIQFVIGFLPFLHANKTLNALDVDGKSKAETMAYTVIIAGLWITWVVSLVVEDHHQPGWFAFAICVYTAMTGSLAIIRGRVRETAGIKGSALEDFLVCFTMYPQAGAQCWLQVSDGDGGSNQTYPAEKPAKVEEVGTVAETCAEVTKTTKI